MEKIVMIDVNEPEEEILFTVEDPKVAELGEILEPPYDFLPEEIDESDPEVGSVK